MAASASSNLFIRDERESTRTTRGTVHHQVGFHDRAVGPKGLLQVVLSGVEGKISYEQFVIHVMCFYPDLLRFPDCSRLSGLESSLNGVHLRICHILKVTSDRADAEQWPFWEGKQPLFTTFFRTTSGALMYQALAQQPRAVPPQDLRKQWGESHSATSILQVQFIAQHAVATRGFGGDKALPATAVQFAGCGRLT